MSRDACLNGVRSALEGIDDRDALLALVADVPFDGDPAAFAQAAIAILTPALEARLAAGAAELERCRAHADQLEADHASWRFLLDLVVSPTVH